MQIKSWQIAFLIIIIVVMFIIGGLFMLQSFGDKRYDLHAANVSDDGKTFYQIIEKEGRVFIIANDKEIEVEKPVDDISSFVMSQNGEHYIYIKDVFDSDNYKQLLVLDGKVINDGDYYNIQNLILSPDGSHFAFSAWMKSENNFYDINNISRFVVLDGIKGKGYKSISSLTFSSDSQHFAYIAENRIDRYIVIDGKEKRVDWNDYHLEKIFSFSPDGKHFAYLTSQENDRTGRIDGYFVDLDDQKSKTYMWADNLIFSADSQHLLYAVEESKNSGRTLMMDGKPMGDFNEFLGVSADFKHFAFKEKNYSENSGIRLSSWTEVVVLDGKEDEKKFNFTKPIILIESFVFSPDGRRYAYVVHEGERVLVGDVYSISKSEKKFIVVGDTASDNNANDLEFLKAAASGVKEENGEIFDLTFSPDGKHFAYRLVKSSDGLFGKSFDIYMVLDGKRSKKYDKVYLSTFSADGRKFTYYAIVNSMISKEIVDLE